MGELAQKASDEKMGLRQWLPLLGITLSAFIFNTSEFMPVALLTDMASDLGVNESVMGAVITVYAWSVMLLSLPLMMFASRFALKRVLLCVICVFLAGQIVTVASSSYWMLVVAMAHAVFWSIASPIAVRLVPEKFGSLALGMVVTGSSIATIVGMPLGRIVGLALGWRSAFLVVAAITAVVLVYLTVVFPKMPAGEPFTISKLPGLLSNKVLVGIYAFIAILVTGYYTAYSYIEPFVQTVAGLSANFATVLLLVLGGAGIIGSVIFGKLGNRHASALISIAIALLLACLVLLLPAADSESHLAVLSIFWGIAIMVIGLGMQVKVLALAPDATDVAMALFSGIFNIGIGAGALVGNQVSLHWSMSTIGYVGAVPALAALIWSVIIFRKWPVSLEEQPQHS